MTQLLVSRNPTSHQVKSCGLPIALAVGAMVGTWREDFLLPFFGTQGGTALGPTLGTDPHTSSIKSPDTTGTLITWLTVWDSGP